MYFEKEFYNQKDDCIDRRYKLTREKWSIHVNQELKEK